MNPYQPKKLEFLRFDTPRNTTEAMEYVRKNGAKGSRRRYSLALLDEAVKVAASHGFAFAVETTGVSIWSIKKHAIALKRRDKTTEQIQKDYRGLKYSYEKLTQTVARARKMHAAGVASFNSALRRACQLENVNYSTVSAMLNRGALK